MLKFIQNSNGDLLMKTNMQDKYKTKDLGEAGALLCKAVVLLELRENGGVVWFIFSSPSMCKEISNKYFFGELLVNAREYNESLRILKNRIFSKV